MSYMCNDKRSWSGIAGQICVDPAVALWCVHHPRLDGSCLGLPVMPLCHMQRTETLHTAVPPEPLHLLSVCHSRCCCWTATTARNMGAAQSQPRQDSSTSTGMNAMEAADEQREWVALPTGVLQHVFSLASTWQTPGPCLASLVCRAWRSAAAGCRGIQLLFHAGHAPADQGFVTWLALTGNAQRLAALTLSRISGTGSTTRVLEALAGAAAAGQPLPLHTLRVLGVQVDTQTAGRLLAALPNLRCLQLALYENVDLAPHDITQDLAPLQQATQLQELYLTGPDLHSSTSTTDVAALLPVSLQRLSWRPQHPQETGTLSHLTQLTFLQLCSKPFWGLCSHQLPSSLRELEQWGDLLDCDLVKQQRQVLTGMEVATNLHYNKERQLLGNLPNLGSAKLICWDLSSDAGRAAVKQLTKLSALTLKVHDMSTLPGALATAATISSLRRLHLVLYGMPSPAGLTALGQLTQLRLSMPYSLATDEQLQAWAEAVGCLPSLRWLSLSGMLLVAGAAWLGGLQQLRVLCVRDIECVRGMSWLEALPPQLQVLCVSRVLAGAQAVQLRTRLQRALASMECEVVVGVDLDEAADPTQQLAGLPDALQQALA